MAGAGDQVREHERVYPTGPHVVGSLVLDLAWQTVRRQPGRYVAAMGAVAAAVMLVLIAGGLYLGLLEAMISYPGSLSGEIVVAEAGGSATMLHSSSHLPKDAAETLRKIPGVQSAFDSASTKFRAGATSPATKFPPPQDRRFSLQDAPCLPARSRRRFRLRRRV